MRLKYLMDRFKSIEDFRDFVDALDGLCRSLEKRYCTDTASRSEIIDDLCLFLKDLKLTTDDEED